MPTINITISQVNFEGANYTPFDALIESVKQECPSMINITAAKYVREAVREFLLETEAWRVKVNFNLYPDENYLSFDHLTPINSEVVRLSSVFANDVELEKRSFKEVGGLKISNLFKGLPRYFSQKLTSFEVFPAPNERVSITADAVLIPEKNANIVHTEVYELFEYAFKAGALFKLMSQVGKPWSNPQRAEHYRERFSTAISREKVKSKVNVEKKEQKIARYI